MNRTASPTRARRVLATVGLTALAAGLLAPLVPAPAGADPVPPVSYATGSIDGQNGWSGSGIPINPSVDQAVVANASAPATFGEQSWRISNAFMTGSFGDFPFSPSVDPAGETAAEGGAFSGPAVNDQFVAEWDFTSADPENHQSGLGVTVSPDRGDGARMSWVRIEDSAGGLNVLFNDFQRVDTPDPCSAGSAFVQTEVATGLARDAAHTLRIEMDFADGPANDVVRVYVDGALVHTGTSWEDYFRCIEGNETRTVDSLLFRTGGSGTIPELSGLGLLIDNVAITSGTSSFSTGFEVLAEPGAPTDLTATPDGDGDVDLSWTAPADDGGSPITTYHVFRDGTEIGTTAGATTFADEDVLASSAAYAYTVTAETAVGTSPESNTANATVNLFWKGFEWDVENGTAEVNGSDEAVLTRFGPGESWIRLTAAPDINGNGTPWARFAYADDGLSYQGIDMFVDSTGGPPNPRLQAGSLFTAELLGYVRYTTPPAGPVVEDFAFVQSDTAGVGPRTAGEHTIYAGQTSSGRIDYNADGTWYSSDFLIGNGAPFAYNDILLRWRCGDSVPSWAVPCSGGESVIFTDFAVGDDHDENGPQITLTTPADGGVYAVGESVTADYECTDDSAITACAGAVADGDPVDTTTPGDYTFTVAAEDEIGNQSSLTHSYSVVDVTPPVVVIDSPVHGSVHAQGGYLEADFTCTEEPEPGSSDLVSCAGDLDGDPIADGDPVNTAQPGDHTLTVTAEDGDGNVTVEAATYTIDAEDPAITITTPADGGTYDQGTSVASDYACTDTGGGTVVACIGTVPVGVGIDTATLGDHNFTVIAVDSVGNLSVLNHTYTVVDGTSPEITILSPADGATYEIGEEVLAAFECSDAGLSGLDSCVGTVGEDDPVDTSTLGDHDFTVTATDGAGNQTVLTVTYTVVDTNGPEITITTPADGAVYEIDEGVTADYACTDISGVDSCVGPVADGAALDTSTPGDFEFTVEAEDTEGNASTLTHQYRVREAGDPTVTITSPEDGAVFHQGQFVEADYSCEDEPGGSGIATCVGPVPDGAGISTAAPGEHEFTVTATDNDGNEASLTHTYTVDATGPTVVITTPVDEGEYSQHSVVPADFSCTDTGGAEVAGCFGSVPDGVPIPTATLGEHTFLVIAQDTVGNLTVVFHTYTVVDDLAPQVVLATPADGASYFVDQVVPADYECEDEPGGSGLASCVGPVADGALIDTSTVGPVAFTVTATDNAGNEAEVTHTYTVVPRPLCRNRSVTVDLALGEDPTSGPDVIRGTNGADDIAALGGDDVVCGRNGADDISLGNGNDIGDGGSKADVITGGDGADKVFGGNGNDLLRGSDGNDHLNGGDGRDALLGQGGNDQLVGGTRRDDCNGGPGIDTGQQCEVKTNIP